MSMSKSTSLIRKTLLAAASVALLGTSQLALADEDGKELAFTRKKGNCLACHMISGGSNAGTIGPALIAMKARFPKREVLKAQIWDATVNNPESPMPPFGKHKILNDKELDAVVDFIWSL